MSRQELIEKYQYIVTIIASKYYKKFKHKHLISYDDMVGMGYVCLLEAVNKHQHKPIDRFSTFVFNHIKWNVLDETNKFFETKKRKRNKIKIINLDNGELEQLSLEKNKIVSNIYKKEILALVDFAIEKYLTPREKMAIILRYKKNMKVEDIAEEMGITAGRVSRLCKNGIRRIKRNLNIGTKKNGKEKTTESTETREREIQSQI